MEIQQVIILLRHLCANTLLGRMMEILIQKYQLWAGLQHHILTNSQPCLWIADRWLSWIRRTLQAYNIKIQYDSWVIPPSEHMRSLSWKL